SNVPKQVQVEKQKQETLSKVADFSGESIVKNINELKGSLNNTLDELLQNLAGEFKKLEDIRSAIVIEQQSLEDMYSLTANTDSLAAMLLVQREKKESFEKEMAETRQQWEQEKVQNKALEKEQSEQLVKSRKREEEEYQYTLKITRQKEKDEYETKKALLEKELTDRKMAFDREIEQREQSVKASEEELARLRQENAEFPVRLETTVRAKEEEVTKTLKMQYDFDIKLMSKQSESDIRLRDQQIEALKEKILEMQAQLKEYGDKAAHAEEGVRDIAVKAIESASKGKFFERMELLPKE
ncbi:MAG: hypothetical protein WCZ43_04095, partial [Proteiniphilum sp.]